LHQVAAGGLSGRQDNKAAAGGDSRTVSCLKADCTTTGAAAAGGAFMLPNISTNKQETRERKGIIRSSSSAGSSAGAGTSTSASASAGAGAVAVIRELAFKNRTV
jgi:hypothetical protein